MGNFNDTVNELLGTVLPTPGTAEILISLASALLLCAVIWLTYRFSNTPASYEPKFAATLVSLALITTILMDLIQSNLALSIGMLGSLSIVRFRTKNIPPGIRTPGNGPFPSVSVPARNRRLSAQLTVKESCLSGMWPDFAVPPKKS